MHTQYLWLMPKYWLNTIFVADANILAEYWHEPNDTIYWEGPLSCGMYGTIARKSNYFLSLPTRQYFPTLILAEVTIYVSLLRSLQAVLKIASLDHFTFQELEVEQSC